MKIIIRSFILAILYFGESAFGLTFDEQFHQRLMEVGWKQCLMELDRYSLDERRYILGRALLSFSRDQIPRDHSRQENLETAQSTLLSIPGHAKYYQDKIESMRTEAIANFKKSDEELDQLRLEGTVVEGGNYDDFREKAFGVLGLLPSSEAVAVLGHFLNDSEGRDRKDLFGRPLIGTDTTYFGRNCVAALIALSNLGIDQPPSQNKRQYDMNYTTFYMTEDEEREVDTWKDWWNQVKGGKRTYRFIGSPIEYGPDGPASIEVIQRVQRNMKRDEERAAGHKKSSSVSESASVITQIRKPSSIAAILTVCALVAGVVWYFIRGRKAA